MVGRKQVSSKRLADLLLGVEGINTNIVKDAKVWERTTNRSLISIIRDNKGPDTDAILKAIADIYEIELYSNIKGLAANKRLTMQLGIDTVSSQKVFILTIKGEDFLCVPDPSDNGLINSVNGILFDGKDALQLVMLTDEATTGIFNRDIQPTIITKNAAVISGFSLEVDEIEDVTEDSDSGVGQVFNGILKSAIEMRTSDIHIVPAEGEGLVYFRIDGKKIHYTEIELGAIERLKNYLVATAGIPENGGPRAPLDGQARLKYDGREVDVRISILKTAEDFYDINIRILDNGVISIHQLGMDEKIKENFFSLFKMSKGIVLIVGPTGSGKSTTLYSGIKSCDYHERNFCTVEDPVEQTLLGITQVSVNAEAGASFADVLKSFLRHDPDVIIVGEIRDLTVAKIAFEASNTGHLVFSTLHTNDAISALPRLMDMGVRPIAICDSLSGVLAQRLVRRVCSSCRTTYMLPKDHYWRELFNLGDEEIELVKGEGCQNCNDTGYKGRMCLNELFIVNNKVREVIAREGSIHEVRAVAEETGFEVMLEDGKRKALAQLTTFEELEPYARDIV